MHDLKNMSLDEALDYMWELIPRSGDGLTTGELNELTVFSHTTTRWLILRLRNQLDAHIPNNHGVRRYTQIYNEKPFWRIQ